MALPTCECVQPGNTPQNQILANIYCALYTLTQGGGGGGDVVGPAGATDSAIALYDTGTGKLIKNSVVTIDATGGITSANAASFIAFGTDPADAGRIRLSNADAIAWEASPAGTDVTLTVNSSEQFVFSAAILSPTLVTPVLGVATATSISFGADPADTGVLRLSNSDLIAWENSPTGTDITMGVNTTAFVLSQNGNAVITSLNASAAANTLYLNSGRVGIGTSTLTDPNGNVMFKVQGAPSTDILNVSDGTAQYSVFINNASVTFPPVSMGSVTAHAFGLFAGNGNPRVMLYASGGVSLGPTYADPGAGKTSVTGDLLLTKTVTAGGTTGNRTINNNSGTVNFAAAATSLVLTNSLVTTNSIVQLTVGTNDTTAARLSYTPNNGSITIRFGTAPTAETRVDFTITN